MPERPERGIRPRSRAPFTPPAKVTLDQRPPQDLTTTDLRRRIELRREELENRIDHAALLAQRASQILAVEEILQARRRPRELAWLGSGLRVAVLFIIGVAWVYASWQLGLGWLQTLALASLIVDFYFVAIVYRTSYVHTKEKDRHEATWRVRETTGSTSVAEELARLADLHDRGVISDDEFTSLKGQSLA